MSDVFNVTASYDKQSYNQSEQIKVVISGDDVSTVQTTTQGKVGPLTLTLTADNGAVTLISLPENIANVTQNSVQHVNVKITAVSDTGPTPRIWTIDSTGKFITSVA